jgi:hypothetical protein
VLVIAAYTANLANFLVSKSSETFSIESFHDAVSMKAPICVAEGSASYGIGTPICGWFRSFMTHNVFKP